MHLYRGIRKIALLVGMLACGMLFGGAATGASIAPGLEQVLSTAAPDQFIPIVVLMEEFPEQQELLGRAGRLVGDARRSMVVESMKRLAQRSQRPVLSSLSGHRDQVRDIRVLWGINGIALKATPDVIQRLASVPGVHKLLHDYALPDPGISRTEGSGEGPTGGDISGPNPAATIRGEVVAMGADQVWDTLGYTGAGVIVAVIDTGIDRTHPDVADHMWTNLDEIPDNGLDDDGNGFIDDTWGWEFCLDNNDPSGGSHGLQVAGQVAGDGTDGIVTGMAPDAELMALGIDCDTPSVGWAASDYALDNGAHVITQSYSWWWTDQPDYEAFRRQTDTELAAGVIHTNSAGNHGSQSVTFPIPYNVSTPANCPAPWIHPDQVVGGISGVLAIGDIHWSTDQIASSSSLGPSAWEDIQVQTDPDYPHTMAPEYQDYPYENGTEPGLIKPDLSAYGTGTASVCPGGGYCNFSGTSSATPHVSGTIALMLQANPAATPADLARTLMTTAEHRGTPGKNNVYGAGLVQAFEAVSQIESTVVYESHTIDDTAYGNGDLAADPGERVAMAVTVRSASDNPVSGLQGFLSTITPGVTIHDRQVFFPELPAGGTVTALAPHFTFSIDPAICSKVVNMYLDLRINGTSHVSQIQFRVGDEVQVAALSDDFETDTGWTSDPGTATQGQFVREDPIGVTGSIGGLSNPEDDTSVPGTTCWVTGNGDLSGKKGEDNNDVDDGEVILLSPPFGSPYFLSLNLTYDRWYYDIQSGGNNMYVEVSNNGGTDWVLLEQLFTNTGGWGNNTVDLFNLMPITNDMRLRFRVSDLGDPGPVEGAVDEVHIDGLFVDCQTFTPGPALPPNPVGDTVEVGKDAAGYALPTWAAPPSDGGHDPADLYRILRSDAPAGPFSEEGSATRTDWIDIDARQSGEIWYYRVIAENAGGTE